MRQQLEFVYGSAVWQETYERLQEIIGQYAYLKDRLPLLPPAQRVTERDVLLITYGDQLQGGPGTPLQTLHGWLNRHLAGVINTVHILPFYPYTSDDGFSVIDYWQVDSALGTWEDVRALHGDFRLMFDGVINHISASSEWFQGFLRGEAPYRDYFLVTDPNLDLSGVTRPRALPLLTRFQTAEGEKYLWTTFSPDQIDLNFANPEMLLQIARLLLFYVSQGADLIRLDAIGYLWKEVGTSSIHLPQTHAVVQILRAVLNECAPNTILITETNVPHRDNISYFGDGTNEAQLVYQFPLVPLVLHALATGQARYLREWAAGLEKLSDTTTFFNFLASHDGIGVVPARDIIGEEGVNLLAERTLAHGGKVSYKNNPDGTQSPYELNITYFDALSNPFDSAETAETRLDRFMVSQAIMTAMAGVPGIYFHSLLGSPNWQAGFVQTGRNRTLNREKLDISELEARLADSTSHTARVFERYLGLLRLRVARPAFHPNARQTVLTTPSEAEAVFALLRTATDGQERVLALHNVSDQTLTLRLPIKDYGFTSSVLTDLFSHKTYSLEATGLLELEMSPYDVLWLLSEA